MFTGRGRKQALAIPLRSLSSFRPPGEVRVRIPPLQDYRAGTERGFVNTELSHHGLGETFQDDTILLSSPAEPQPIPLLLAVRRSASCQDRKTFLTCQLRAQCDFKLPPLLPSLRYPTQPLPEMTRSRRLYWIPSLLCF